MMNKEERHTLILQFMEQSDQRLATRDLAGRLGVSEMTVRRDLHALSKEGRLQRQHGGAILPARPEENRKEVGILLISRTGKYSDPFFNALLEGVDRRLGELGYRIAYINTHNEINTAAQVDQLLRSNDVSGIILIGPPLGAESLAYLKANLRVLIGTIDSIGAEYDTIAFDSHRGMSQMVDHLVNCGHRRLGFITGYSDTREQAFIDRLKFHQLCSEPELRILVPFGIDGWTPQLGYTGVQQLMQLTQRPDAVVCASDLIAIGAIQWLHQHGFRVPDDIAVTGFDNIPESAFTVPPLTTIHVHKQLMGELAAERIVKHIENEAEIPLLIQTPTRLVIRQSCGSTQASK